jgi:hypothetical protein
MTVTSWLVLASILGVLTFGVIGSHLAYYPGQPFLDQTSARDLCIKREGVTLRGTHPNDYAEMAAQVCDAAYRMTGSYGR